MDIDAASVRALAADAPPMLEWPHFMDLAAALARLHPQAMPPPSTASQQPRPPQQAPPSSAATAQHSASTGRGASRPATASSARDGAPYLVLEPGYNPLNGGYHYPAAPSRPPSASVGGGGDAVDAVAADAMEAAAADAAAYSIGSDVIIAAQELRLDKLPRARLTAHLSATTAAASGEPPCPKRRSEAFPIADIVSPINLAIVATTSRALNLVIEAYPAAESLMGELSAARLHQASGLLPSRPR